MLFNSLIFLFVFLPITLTGFLWLNRSGQGRLAVMFMIAASVIFYAYWYPPHVIIFLGSVIGNFVLGRAIAEHRNATIRRILVTVGVTANLALLGFFKYSAFLAEIVLGQGAGGDFMSVLTSTALPIGISFYTFQQIAFLVDVSHEPRRYSFLEYAFFISFFPHLIAGPLLHHREIIPQISQLAVRLRGDRYAVGFLAPGIALLIIGLTKKVILADTFGDLANIAFDGAARGEPLTFLDAWGGAVAYAWQIYFDFSAYSDMAIGLGLMLGIRLPINFNSPYKATSIIDFWRRWHITLSRFLRDYLYIPLGGNRRGEARRYVNILATMVLGGLWHGAGFTFILWGFIHGLLLALNHGLRSVMSWKPPRWLAVGVTLTLVILAWVPFRAASLAVTAEFWQAMLGFGGIALPAAYGSVVSALGPVATIFNIHVGQVQLLDGLRQPALLAIGLLIVLGTPNAMSILQPAARRRVMASRWAATGIGFMLATSIVAIFVRENATFLYFQF